VTGQRPGGTEKNQSGSTLVEILIVIALTGILGAGVMTAIYQVYEVNASGVARMMAVKEVENAVHWITRDALMAQREPMFEEDEDSRLRKIILTWVEWDGNVNVVTYFFEKDGQLKRCYEVNDVSQSQTIVMASLNTDPAMTKYNFSKPALDITITATVSGFRPVSETRRFNVVLRSAP
jgi:type II secretory pathway pseudopilin PulG